MFFDDTPLLIRIEKIQDFNFEGLDVLLVCLSLSVSVSSSLCFRLKLALTVYHFLTTNTLHGSGGAELFHLHFMNKLDFNCQVL